MGILGCGYLLKQRMKNKSSHANNDVPLPINDDLISNNQQMQIIPFIEINEIDEENHHETYADVQMQLVKTQ